MDFGKRLREYRLKEGFSLMELAVSLNTSPSTLSKYENGEMLPKIDTLLSLCLSLNCTPNEILGTEKKELQEFSPITIECAEIIESMNSSQKQWLYLTIDGIKSSIKNIEKSNRFKTDFLRS